MKNLTATICFAVAVLFVAAMVTADSAANAEPIYHEINYPDGNGPFPIVIALHTSGGFKTVKKQVSKYTNAGYAVYAPDFFKRHGISKSNRFETWTTYRKAIEAELLELIEVIKKTLKPMQKISLLLAFQMEDTGRVFLRLGNM